MGTVTGRPGRLVAASPADPGGGARTLIQAGLPDPTARRLLGPDGNPVPPTDAES